MPCCYVEIWGKPTTANRTGYRQVPLPRESYRALMLHFKAYDELCWVDSRGNLNYLAGPVVAREPGRPINLEEQRSFHKGPLSFQVKPDKQARKRVKRALKRAFVAAGVDCPGMGAQSFRRAYTDEFLTNGGTKLWLDRILGHFKVADMTDLYHHTTIDPVWEQAEKHAPSGLPAGRGCPRASWRWLGGSTEALGQRY